MCDTLGGRGHVFPSHLLPPLVGVTFLILGGVIAVGVAKLPWAI